MFKTLFHLLVVIHYYYTIYYWFAEVTLPDSFSKTIHILGKFDYFKFLTNWDVVLQAVFFTVCLTNDLLGYNKEANPKTPSALRNLQDVMLSSLAFPVALFVASTFWILYGIDRELILPKALDQYLPSWYNHSIHTNVLIFATLELLTSYRKYPTTKKGLSILQGLLVAYLLWSLTLTILTGQWVYPILNVLNWPERILFILGSTACSNIFYFVGKFINDLRWRNELKSANGSRQRGSKNSRNKSKFV